MLRPYPLTMGLLAPLAVWSAAFGKKRRRRWWPWLLLLALVGVGVMAVGCEETTPSEPTPLPPTLPPTPGTPEPPPSYTPPPTHTPPPTSTTTPIPETCTPMPPEPPTTTPEIPTPGSDAYELAKMMWFEMRDHPGSDAMVGAGWVAVNRLHNPSVWGESTLVGILLQEFNGVPQFQGYYYYHHLDPAELVKDRVPDDPDRKQWERALELSPGIVNLQGTDPTNGAEYFGDSDWALQQMEDWAAIDPEFEYGTLGKPNPQGELFRYSNKDYTRPLPTPTP